MAAAAARASFPVTSIIQELQNAKVLPHPQSVIKIQEIKDNLIADPRTKTTAVGAKVKAEVCLSLAEIGQEKDVNMKTASESLEIAVKLIRRVKITFEQRTAFCNETKSLYGRVKLQGQEEEVKAATKALSITFMDFNLIEIERLLSAGDCSTAESMAFEFRKINYLLPRQLITLGGCYVKLFEKGRKDIDQTTAATYLKNAAAELKTVNANLYSKILHTRLKGHFELLFQLTNRTEYQEAAGQCAQMIGSIPDPSPGPLLAEIKSMIKTDFNAAHRAFNDVINYKIQQNANLVELVSVYTEFLRNLPAEQNKDQWITTIEKTIESTVTDLRSIPKEYILRNSLFTLMAHRIGELIPLMGEDRKAWLEEKRKICLDSITRKSYFSPLVIFGIAVAAIAILALVYRRVRWQQA